VTRPIAGTERSRGMQTGGVTVEPEVPAEMENDVALTDDERAARHQAVADLVEMIRPAVQADGGDLALVSADVDTGVVEVELQGSCSSCAISSTTLQAGVSRIMQERLDWITEVRGGIDESISYEESSSMGAGGYVPKF
jgi:Fe-S cluster biogenesis protein NfuA